MIYLREKYAQKYEISPKDCFESGQLKKNYGTN